MVNVAVFGPIDIIKKISKKGTESDLLCYNLKTKQYYTFITPNSEKFQSKLFAANLSHCALIIVPQTGPDLVTGEAVLILDALKLPGLIVSPPGFEDQLKQISAATIVESYPIINIADFDLNTINQLNPNLKEDGNPRVHIDHFFQVKSVGLVVLSTVRGGTITQYDPMIVNPTTRQVVVKSMQVHDVDVKQAKIGDRVGLALKGIDIGELDRGFIISKTPLPKTEQLKIKFNQIKFAPKIEKLQNVMVNVGLQYIPGLITEVSDTVTIDLEKPIVLDGPILIARPQLPKIKLVGWGTPI